MMNNLLKTATRPSMANRAKLFSAAPSQRALHTPLGSSQTKDDAFQVSTHTQALLITSKVKDATRNTEKQSTRKKERIVATNRHYNRITVIYLSF